jgi:hypothetical protein
VSESDAQSRTEQLSPKRSAEGQTYLLMIASEEPAIRTILTKLQPLSSTMKLSISLLLLLQASVASAEVLSLDGSNIMELTEGKSIFIKFFAPWVSFKLRTGIAF